MQLRLKLAAIASAMAIAASLAVAFAGPAAAADNVKLCVPDSSNGYQICAESIALAGSIIDGVTYDNAGAYNVPSGKGQISQGTSGLCMELDGTTSGSPIKLESCAGKASEEWTTSAGQEKGTTVFRNADITSLCLNMDPYADKGVHPQVLADTCSSNNSNLNQEWAQYTT
jgi:hypothetical protein